MGTRWVVVRYDSLRFDPNNKIVLPGGTKEGRFAAAVGEDGLLGFAEH